MNSIRSSLGPGAPHAGLRATAAAAPALVGRDGAVTAPSGARPDYPGRNTVSRTAPTSRVNAADLVTWHAPAEESEVYGADLASGVTSRGDLRRDPKRAAPARHTTRTDPAAGPCSGAGHRTRPRTAPRPGAVPGGPYRGQDRTRPGGPDPVLRAHLE
jgi:hypothetical protein